MSCKLVFWWLHLYYVYNLVKNKDIYILEKCDGLRLVDILVGNRHKNFCFRKLFQLDHIHKLDHEKIPPPNNFLVANNHSDLSNILNDFHLWHFPLPYLSSWTKWKCTDMRNFDFFCCSLEFALVCYLFFYVS